MGRWKGFVQRTQYLLLPPAFPATLTGQSQIPQQQLVRIPSCSKGCAGHAHQQRHVKASPPLSETVSSCISQVLSLNEVLTAWSLPGEMIQPSRTATAQGFYALQAASYFCPFKIYFWYFCGLRCHQIRTLIIFNTFILIAFCGRESGFVSVL